ncbi:amidohydrolase family protein [Chloroflexota bacterium]
MIIDAHTHGLHGGYFEPLLKAGGKWARQQVQEDIERAGPRPEFHDPKLRLKQMDRFGIDFQVVTPGHWIDSDRYPGAATTKMAIARALNDNMAALMEAGKGRMPAVGTISLLGFEKGGRQEMERALKHLGLKGFSVASNIVGKPLDIFEPFWAAAEELNEPVYIHPRHPQGYSGRLYEKDYDLAQSYGWPYETVLALARLVLSGIIKRHPHLNIVSHHLGGGMIPFFMGRLLDKIEDRRTAEDMLNQFKLIYYDTAVGSNAPAIRLALDVLGTERIVFASDVPWGLDSGNNRLEDYPKLIRSLGLPQKITDAIFADNIRRIIKIP